MIEEIRKRPMVENYLLHILLVILPLFAKISGSRESKYP